MMNFAQIPILGRTGFHPFYNRVLNKAVSLGYTLPTSAQQRQQNTLVVSLVNENVWELLDLVYVPANNAGSNFSRINWIDPDNYLLTINGGITHTSNQGFVGAASAYLNTGWNPSVNGVNYAEDNASVLAYSFNDFVQTNNAIFGWQGASEAGRTILDPRNGDNTRTWQINRDTTLAAAGTETSSVGLYHLDRSSSSFQELFKNGTQIATDNTGTTSLSNVNAYLLAANNNGTDAAHGASRVLSFFAVGASLSSKASTIDSIVSNYIDNL